MAFKLSSGLRDALLTDNDFKAEMDGGVIRIYNGTVPATADAALAGNTLLCTISDNDTGTGLNFDTTAAAGVLAKAPAQVWKGTIVANGTATFYRFSGLGDAGGSSTSEKRLQGSVGVVGAELNFSSATFVDNGTNTKSINTYVVTQPTA